MSLPGWWQATILALAAFRLFRLLSYDDLPPVARARAWLLGEEVARIEGCPDPIYQYRWPTLAHFVGCGFCLGAWVSFAAYGAWLLWPRGVFYAATPLALSAVVGLIVKRLDP